MSIMNNMPQNNFMPVNYSSPNMTPSRNQPGHMPMMGKSQMMQPSFNYPNGSQMNINQNPSVRADTKVIHIKMNDPVQTENFQLQANVYSHLKIEKITLYSINLFSRV